MGGGVGRGRRGRKIYVLGSRRDFSVASCREGESARESDIYGERERQTETQRETERQKQRERETETE